MNLKLLFPWISQTIFFLGILPQIRLNFKLKSTKGLSDFLFIGYFYAYMAYIFYVFCLDLTLAHKIFIPSGFILVLILIFQRFYYSDKKEVKLKLFFLISFILFFLILTPFAVKNPMFIGNLLGWLMATIWAVHQIPQIFKNYKSSSVQGLSFGLLTIMGMGDFIEVIAAFCLGLPQQTYLNSLRGVVVYFIFCLQFFIFRSKNFTE